MKISVPQRLKECKKDGRPFSMFTSSILVILFVLVTQFSFQESCYSEPTETVLRTEATPIGSKEINLEIYTLGLKDPKAAVLYALEKQKEGHSDVSFPYFHGRVWYKKNPKQFMEWASALNKEQFRQANTCTTFLPNNINSSEGDEFVRDKMARGEKRNEAIFSICRKKVLQNPREAASWAESFPEHDAGRIYAINSVTYWWSRKNPYDAINWLNSICEVLPSSEDSAMISQSVTHCYNEIYKESPAIALDWATKNPNKQIRDQECYRLMKKWVTTDKDTPRAYISEVSDPQIRLPLWVGYLSDCKLSYDEFPVVADWLLSLEASPFKDGEIGLFPNFLSKWINKDPKGALAWIKNAPTFDKQDGAAKGNIVASLMAGENPYTSKRFSKEEKGKTIKETIAEILSGSAMATTPSAMPSKPVSKDVAQLVWSGVLVLLIAFSIRKTFQIAVCDAPLWTVKTPLILTVFIFLFSGLLGLHQSVAKTCISVEGSVLELAASCFSSMFIVGYFWIYVNQCAAGSRAFPFTGVFFVLIGVSLLLMGIIKKQSTLLGAEVLIFGAVILTASLFRSAKHYRANSRVSKQSIPPYLIYSPLPFLAIFVYGVGGVMIKNIGSNSKPMLFMLFMLLLSFFIYFGPIYWGLRWRDGFVLRFYQMLLLAVCLFSFFLIFGFFTSGLNIKTLIQYLFLSLAFCTSLALTFHSSVRKWAQGLRPAL